MSEDLDINELIKDYEQEVVLRMFDKRIIGEKGYTSIQRIAQKVKWKDISREFNCKKSFQSVIRHLVSLQVVDDHGKRGKAGSLSKLGVFVAKQLTKTRKFFA